MSTGRDIEKSFLVKRICFTRVMDSLYPFCDPHSFSRSVSQQLSCGKTKWQELFMNTYFASKTESMRMGGGFTLNLVLFPFEILSRSRSWSNLVTGLSEQKRSIDLNSKSLSVSRMTSLLIIKAQWELINKYLRLIILVNTDRNLAYDIKHSNTRV